MTTPLGTTLEEPLRRRPGPGLVATGGLVGASRRSTTRPWCRTGPSSTTSSATAPASAGCPSAGWARSPTPRRVAADAGAEILTGAGVSGIRAGDDAAEVTWHDGTEAHTVGSRHVLADVAPWVLSVLLGGPDDTTTRPVGSQVQLTMLLERLPRLKSGVDPASAFAGSFHVAQSFPELMSAYDVAAGGRLPEPLPGAVLPLAHRPDGARRPAGTGAHTLTYVGILAPAKLFADQPSAAKAHVISRAVAALDEHLAEPLASCLARDAHGQLCVEALIPQDLEAQLAMPGGHIYHGDPDWPWAPNRARLETPAQQWGVQTDVDAVLVCGAGARRGGGISGIAGHNAAQAVLALR